MSMNNDKYEVSRPEIQINSVITKKFIFVGFELQTYQLQSQLTIDSAKAPCNSSISISFY